MPTREIPLQEFSQLDSDRLNDTLSEHPNRTSPELRSWLNNMSAFAEALRDQEPYLDGSLRITQEILNVWYTMALHHIEHIERVLSNRGQEVELEGQTMAQQQLNEYLEFIANYQQVLERDQQLQQEQLEQERFERFQQLEQEQLEQEQLQQLFRQRSIQAQQLVDRRKVPKPKYPRRGM